MSEVNVKPTSEIHWADGGSPYTSTDPGGSKKDAGYDPGPPGEIPTAEHWNWLLREYANHTNWMAYFIRREFDEIDNAIQAGITWPQRFDYVRQTAVVTPGSQNYSTQGAIGATPILGGCTDGRNIYYLQGAYAVCARLESPGTIVWSKADVTAWVIIATDGRYLYGSDTGVNGIRLYDPSDGSIYATWNDHSGTYPTMIAACGRWIALVDVGDDEVVHVYGHTSGGTKSYLGSYDHGAPITAMCLQGDALYIGSSAAGTGTVYLRKIALPGLTATWSIDPGWNSTPTFQALSCDGRFLYSGHDREEVSPGGPYGQIHCWNIVDGSLLWSTDLGAGPEITQISHDHDLILGMDSGGPVAYFFDKATGALWLTVAKELSFLDGARAIGSDGNNLIRHWLDRSRVEYQINETYDQYRPMVWMVATPLK